LNRTDRKIIIRYSLFQIPSLLVVIFLIFTVNHWYPLGDLLKIVIILLWALKDILMFPFVRKAYSQKDRDKSKSILGETGVAIEVINPKGFVKIRGEIWQAELTENDIPILKGDRVEVVNIDGLKLKVQKQV